MRQILQNLRSGETQLAEVPCPAARPGTLLIQTEASLISAGTERMADSLVWFRDHPEERSAMGARSRAFAEREFAREKLADQFVNVIEAVHERWDGGYVELPQSVGAA